MRAGSTRTVVEVGDSALRAGRDARVRGAAIVEYRHRISPLECSATLALSEVLFGFLCICPVCRYYPAINNNNNNNNSE